MSKKRFIAIFLLIFLIAVTTIAAALRSESTISKTLAAEGDGSEFEDKKCSERVRDKIEGINKYSCNSDLDTACDIAERDAENECKAQLDTEKGKCEQGSKCTFSGECKTEVTIMIQVQDSSDYATKAGCNVPQKKGGVKFYCEATSKANPICADKKTPGKL